MYMYIMCIYITGQICFHVKFISIYNLHNYIIGERKGAGEKGVEREWIFPWEKQIKLNDLFNLPYSSLVI